jgi:hypothetical protein
LTYYVASTLEDVLEAWSLVYQAYRRAGLIDPNPFEIHTVPQAVGPQTMVVTGMMGPEVGTTVSAYIDHPGGLPLDTVYRPEIDGLRAEGRKVMEVGLFGDRRDHLTRSSVGLFELMRFAFFYAVHTKCDDALIGIHPRHAPFYQRYIGLEPMADLRTHPAVKDHPVVLMRMDFRAKRERMPKGLAYFVNNELPEKVFASRFTFDEASLNDSTLTRYLAYKQKQVKAA